jgi:hypothetical protein
MQREALLESGGKIEDHPELLSSDDENAASLMKAKFDGQKDEDVNTEPVLITRTEVVDNDGDSDSEADLLD